MIAYKFLPLSALPQVDYPTIRVQTLYPGASPEVMTSSITAPLERQFGQMPGLNQMTSTSSAGASSITLQFDLALGLDVAEQQVQAAINAAGNLLPSDLPSPPVYAKINPADAPVLTLAVTSKSEPLTKVHDMVDTGSPRRSPSFPASAWSASRAARSPACASVPTRPRWRPTASMSTICGRRSPTPTSTRPRAISTGRRGLHHQRQRPGHRSRDLPRHRRRYRNGAPVRCPTSRPSKKRRRTTGWSPG